MGAKIWRTDTWKRVENQGGATQWGLDVLGKQLAGTTKGVGDAKLEVPMKMGSVEEVSPILAFHYSTILGCSEGNSYLKWSNMRTNRHNPNCIFPQKKGGHNWQI